MKSNQVYFVQIYRNSDNHDTSYTLSRTARLKWRLQNPNAFSTLW